MTENDEALISEKHLRAAAKILEADAHTSRVETLATALCILLSGVIEKLLDEYEPEVRQR
jgi:hypothetical protein